MANQNKPAEKTHTGVIIGGKRYNVVSYETNEYIEGLAGHINDKITKVMESGNNIAGEKPLVLAALNICDEYFKVYSAGMDMQKEIADVTNERDLLQAKLSALPENAGEAGALKEKLEAAEAELAKTKSALKVLEDSLKGSEQKLSAAEKEIKSGKTQADKLKAAKNKAVSEITAMTAKIKSLEDEIERLNKKSEDQSAKIKKLSSIKDNADEADNLRQQVVDYSKDLTKADSTIKSLEDKIKTLQKKSEDELEKKLSEQRREYERRIEDLKAEHLKREEALNNEFLEMIDKSQ